MGSTPADPSNPLSSRRNIADLGAEDWRVALHHVCHQIVDAIDHAALSEELEVVELAGIPSTSHVGVDTAPGVDGVFGSVDALLPVDFAIPVVVPVLIAAVVGEPHRLAHKG